MIRIKEGANSMENTYEFSDQAIKDYKKRNYTMMFTIPIIIIVFSFVLFKIEKMDDLVLFVSIITGITVFIMLEIFIVSKIMIKKMKKTRLDISENHFIRSGGGKSERVSFEHIKSVKEKRDPKGKLLLIELKTNNKAMNMFGFDDLEEILEIIKERSPDGVILNQKIYKLDWNNPIVTVAIMLTTILVIALVMNFDKNLYFIANMIFVSGFSLFIFFYKPISKSLGSRFRIFEIISSSLMLGGSLMFMIGMFISK